MSDNSKIQWTDATWNPVAGCTPVSRGCANCYAAGTAKRLVAMGKEKYKGTVDQHGRWTGKINLDHKALDTPLHWRRPRRVFVNSMSDLFHENVPFSFVDSVFAVMAKSPRHTFQILTKRPKRMMEYLAQFPVNYISDTDERSLGGFRWEYGEKFPAWPLPNVWLGVSVEDQKSADERIPLLLECDAAVRFLSIEPLVGPVSISKHLRRTRKVHLALSVEGALRNRAFSGITDKDGRPLSREEAKSALEELVSEGVRMLPMVDCPNFSDQEGCQCPYVDTINWVVAGGESQTHAQPAHPQWFRDLRDECNRASVPFFFKQWGAWRPVYERDTDPGWRDIPSKASNRRWVNIEGGQGFHGAHLVCMQKGSPKTTGRELDGRTWDEFPVVGATEGATHA